MRAILNYVAVLCLLSAAVMSQSASEQSPGTQPNSPQTPQAPASSASPPSSATQSQPSPDSSKPDQGPVEDVHHPRLMHRPVHKTTHQRSGAKSQSGKVVVKNGGAKEGSAQLAPPMSKAQEQQSRDNTNQLLATTNANLKSISSRQLTPAQQNAVEQIRAYMSQSKAAADAGDLERAHTLAYKAHLLSNDLAKK
jgi:hypothetical protein